MSRLTSLDASFLYLEQPSTLMHVASICTFAQRLDYERLLGYIEERLPLIPRYTQRVAMVPLHLAHPVWEDDPEFDLRHHIVRQRLRKGNDDRALAALCAELFSEPLDRSRPLWEMHVIDGYGAGSALLAKTHHCMIDGASGVQLMNLLMDPTPQPPRIELPATSHQAARRPSTALGQLVDGVADSLANQLALGRQLLDSLRQPAKAWQQARATVDALGTLVRTLSSDAPPTPFNGRVGPRRSLGWVTFSLNEVKAIKNRLGGTVNDVILAVIAGGLRRYLRRHGCKVDRTELRAMVPVNVRREHEALRLGNRVSMMVAPLPVGIHDPLERLRQVSAAMELLKASGQAGQMERVVALTDLLPPFLQAPLAQLQASVTPVNTVCTNVPGPRETRYLLGQSVQTMVPLVPLAAGVGLGFAILSYADQITIGLTADGDRVADVWDLAGDLRHGLDELWTATGLERAAPQPAAPRRPSRRRRRKGVTDDALDAVPPQAAGS
jgi:WS/DGAT/MGAT family acyltransferase